MKSIHSKIRRKGLLKWIEMSYINEYQNAQKFCLSGLSINKMSIQRAGLIMIWVHFHVSFLNSYEKWKKTPISLIAPIRFTCLHVLKISTHFDYTFVTQTVPFNEYGTGTNQGLPYKVWIMYRQLDQGALRQSTQSK